MINGFEKDGHSQREIAKKINRSRYLVNNYIKNKNKIPKKIPGRPEKLSPRNKRAIIRDVGKSGKSVSQIQLPGDINVSRWTIWRTLKNCPNVEYSKRQKAPSWKEPHIKASLAFITKSSSSSSSCRAACTDIPDPLSPLLPIIHRLWQVFRATSCILT